ncbi:MAG: hypothetical protein ACJAY8_000051 [Sphingobacteriales bacterium]|jgi:hypothetical protein
MIKKAILFFSFLVLVPTFLSGQAQERLSEVFWGTKYAMEENRRPDKLIGNDDTGFYTQSHRAGNLWQRESDYFIEHYNQELKKTKSVVLNLKGKKNESELESCIMMNKKLFLFTSQRNKKTKIKSLFVQEIDKSTLIPSAGKILVAEIPNTKKPRLLYGINAASAGVFILKLSQDKSKLLVFSTLGLEKGATKEFAFYVLDHNLNELWNKKIKLSASEENFVVNNYTLDNFGNLHVLRENLEEDSRISFRNKSIGSYSILSYTNEGNTIVENPVVLEGKFLTDLRIGIDTERNIVCAGFYSSEGKGSIEGTFFIKLKSDDKKVISSKFEKFDLDFITEHLSEKEKGKKLRKAAKGKSAELVEYELDEIIMCQDGGSILIGEQYYVESVHVNTGAGANASSYTNYYYVFNDIIAIKMSPEGSIDWKKKIAKHQITKNDGGYYSSYALANANDNLYFVYNDSPKNINNQEGDKLYYYEKEEETIIVLAVLDNEGNLNKETISFSNKVEVMARPFISKQIGADEMLMLGLSNDMFRFSKLKLK